MSETDWIQLVCAFVLVILAGFSAAAEAALYSFSRSRADRLVADGRPGAVKVRKIVDDPPRYLNTALFLRTVFEICAIVLVAVVVFGQFHDTWEPVVITAGVMIVVSYVFWGVAPRTLGRQHSDQVACAVAGSLVAVTTVLGPFPATADHDRQRADPGQGVHRRSVLDGG